MVFTAYPCLYWLAGHAYGAFGEDCLSITDSFALSIGNMVAHPYAGIAPANDLGRGLILVQQISMFTLLAVALAFVSARWEPSKEVQQAWRYVTRTRP